MACAPVYSSGFKNRILPKHNFSHNLISSNKNVKTVITKGFGSSVDEASQNALKNALIQVVGSFIDSETLFTKEEINDGIVELSKTIKGIFKIILGVLQYFEILKTEEKDGILLLKQKLKL